MASFAVLQGSTVIAVIKVDDSVLIDPDGNESEALGQAFLADTYGTEPGIYVQTSYTNAPIDGHDRGKYAGIGDLWTGDKFVSQGDEP